MASSGVIVQGYEALQAANKRWLDAVQPAGALGRAVLYATSIFRQAAIAGTPVDTGTLRASHLVDVQGLHALLYIAPHRNPKRGGLANQYGPVIHQRGGRYAFYGNAFDSTYQPAADGVAKLILEAL